MSKILIWKFLKIEFPSKRFFCMRNRYIEKFLQSAFFKKHKISRFSSFFLLDFTNFFLFIFFHRLILINSEFFLSSDRFCWFHSRFFAVLRGGLEKWKIECSIFACLMTFCEMRLKFFGNFEIDWWVIENGRDFEIEIDEIWFVLIIIW